MEVLVNKNDVRWWERFLARRVGMAMVRKPTADWPADPMLDYVMAFHYCPTIGQYRFDRHYEAQSHSERFTCGVCNVTYHTRSFLGFTALQVRDAWELASRHRSLPVHVLTFLWFLAFGLGRHLPETRNGKTTGELEWEALLWLRSVVFASLSDAQ